MKVQTRTVDDFLQNIEGAADLWNKTIFYQKACIPLCENQRESTSFDLILVLSAVIVFENEDQAMLTCEAFCGLDRSTADACSEGSDRFNELMGQLTKTCMERSWHLLPGTLEA